MDSKLPIFVENPEECQWTTKRPSNIGPVIAEEDFDSFSQKTGQFQKAFLRLHGNFLSLAPVIREILLFARWLAQSFCSCIFEVKRQLMQKSEKK